MQVSRKNVKQTEHNSKSPPDMQRTAQFFDVKPNYQIERQGSSEITSNEQNALEEKQHNQLPKIMTDSVFYSNDRRGSSSTLSTDWSLQSSMNSFVQSNVGIYSSVPSSPYQGVFADSLIEFPADTMPSMRRKEQSEGMSRKKIPLNCQFGLRSFNEVSINKQPSILVKESENTNQDEFWSKINSIIEPTSTDQKVHVRINQPKTIPKHSLAETNVSSIEKQSTLGKLKIMNFQENFDQNKDLSRLSQNPLKKISIYSAFYEGRNRSSYNILEQPICPLRASSTSSQKIFYPNNDSACFFNDTKPSLLQKHQRNQVICLKPTIIKQLNVNDTFSQANQLFPSIHGKDLSKFEDEIGQGSLQIKDENIFQRKTQNMQNRLNNYTMKFKFPTHRIQTKLQKQLQLDQLNQVHCNSPVIVNKKEYLSAPSSLKNETFKLPRKDTHISQELSEFSFCFQKSFQDCDDTTESNYLLDSNIVGTDNQMRSYAIHQIDSMKQMERIESKGKFKLKCRVQQNLVKKIFGFDPPKF